MSTLRIAAVSYLNTLPFIHAISAYFKDDYELSLDIPSLCALKLKNESVDVALVPVAIIPSLSNCKIVTSYCIGAVGPVASVMLYSQVPLKDIKTIYLDYQSMTSVKLVRVLAQNYWKIKPQWKEATIGYEQKVQADVAGVVIGDRALEMRNTYRYAYDLAEEWQKYSSLPFTFACWVAHNKVKDNRINAFNEAIKQGIIEIDSILLGYKGNLSKDFAREYLTKNISYDFDEKKKQAMHLFLRDIYQLAETRISS